MDFANVDNPNSCFLSQACLRAIRLKINTRSMLPHFQRRIRKYSSAYVSGKFVQRVQVRIKESVVGISEGRRENESK